MVFSGTTCSTSVSESDVYFDPSDSSKGSLCLVSSQVWWFTLCVYFRVLQKLMLERRQDSEGFVLFVTCNQNEFWRCRQFLLLISFKECPLRTGIVTFKKQLWHITFCWFYADSVTRSLNIILDHSWSWSVLSLTS